MSVSEAVEAAKPPEDVRLRRNELSLRHIVTSTLANIAPAMSFFFGFAVIVQGAGIAAPLTILTAMIGILLLTNSTAEFSRFTPSAGSFVTFTGKALGPSIGAAISVFVLFGYIVAASTVVSVAGIWIAQIWGLVEPGQSWPFNIFPWVALAVLVLALIYGLIIARLSPELAHRTGSYVADE